MLVGKARVLRIIELSTGFYQMTFNGEDGDVKTLGVYQCQKQASPASQQDAYPRQGDDSAVVYSRPKQYSKVAYWMSLGKTTVFGLFFWKGAQCVWTRA